MIDAPKTRRSRDSAAVDAVLEALADGHRRRVLYYLLETDGAASVDDLVRHLADRTEADPDTVPIRLHHATLPLLDDRDLVDYDPSGRQVRYSGGPLATELLDWTGNRERID